MKQGEKVAAFGAGVLFLVALFWALFSDGPGKEGRGPGGADSARSFPVESLPEGSPKGPVEWGQPSPQGGANWIFDIFTPPVIYYDEATGNFTVTPPFPDAGPIEESFELELVEISSIPYRFQLVSYAGARGNFVLTLENLDDGRDVFAAPGETLADHGIRIVDFIEKREVARSSRLGTTEAFDLVGEALVEDTTTGKRYTLRHNQITYQDNPVARFTTMSEITST